MSVLENQRSNEMKSCKLGERLSTDQSGVEQLERAFETSPLARQSRDDSSNQKPP
jgi:hypothetical protein